MSGGSTSATHRRLATGPQLITVIMPARNAARTIGAQLDALAAQDYTGEWELIVVDDGSTDSTSEIVEHHRGRFPRGRLIRAAAAPTANRAARARNLGAAAAAGDLLAFCDADDVVAPGWLSGIADAARDADIVASSLELTTLNEPELLRWHDKPWPNGSRHRSLSWASTAGLAVWRDVLEAARGFDEEHPGAEDKDLSWRVQLLGYRLQLATDAAVAYRYRLGLWETARQEYRWGKADVRLFRDFRPAGMARPAARTTLRGWAQTLYLIPLLPFSSVQRGRWTVGTARRCGRLMGSFHERVLFL